MTPQGFIEKCMKIYTKVTLDIKNSKKMSEVLPQMKHGFIKYCHLGQQERPH